MAAFVIIFVVERNVCSVQCIVQYAQNGYAISADLEPNKFNNNNNYYNYKNYYSVLYFADVVIVIPDRNADNHSYENKNQNHCANIRPPTW